MNDDKLCPGWWILPGAAVGFAMWAALFALAWWLL
jgi:hypothetical protein